MAVILLFGARRNDLRETCLRQVCELTRAWPDKRAILLVPEQTKMDMEYDYLQLSGQTGLMMAEVLSFRRLAWRLLGEVGRQPLQPVDSVGQAMLLHRILKQEQVRLHTFGFLADKPGFVSQVAAAIGDLKRYRIDGAQLLQASPDLADRSLQQKTRDLGLILREYDRLLAEMGLSDAEDDLNRLADILQTLCDLPPEQWPWPWPRLAWLRRTSIWVSGFGELRDFTPQEDLVLAGLARLAEKLTVSVSADYVPFDRRAIENGPDLFLPGRKTAWRLTQNFPGLALLHLPDQLQGVAKVLDAGLRAGGAHRAASEPADRLDAESQTYLHLIQADSPDAELSWVAGEVRRLVQLEQYRYRDITLALADLPGYSQRLRSVCREYGIPVFLDSERPLQGTPLMRFVIALLDIWLADWSRQALMNCLRSGMTPLSAPEIDQLENEWLARGLFRSDRLFNDRLYLGGPPPVRQDADPGAAADPTGADHGDADDGDAADNDADDGDDGDDGDDRDNNPGDGRSAGIPDPTGLLSLRDRALLPVREGLAILHRAETVAEKCLELRRFMTRYGLPDRITSLTAVWAASGEMEAAVTLTQSWNELDRMLNQMVRMAGSMPLSMQAFRDTLAAGMDSAASGVIPSAIDQVGVGDLRRAMLRQPRVLFLIGALAANLPPAPPPEGLLKDLDRQALSRLLLRQLPSSARDQVFADACNLHALLTLPADRLYLTAPDASLSPVFRWLAALYPSAFHRLPVLPTWDDARLNAPRPALSRLLAARRSPDARSDAERENWNRLERILDDGGLPLPEPAVAPAVGLAPEQVRSLYGQPVILSISQLERYAACPFRHLSEQLLALRIRPVWTPQTAETGIMLHTVLELAVGQLMRELTPSITGDAAALARFWQQWLASDPDKQAQAWLAEAAGQTGLERFFDSGLQASVGRRIKQVAISSLQAIIRQYRQDAYLPYHLEWTFGPRDSRPVMLQLPDRTPVFLRGKVDRIDRQSGGNGDLFRIVDYKSSDKRIDYDCLYQGLSLQMPVYLTAFARADPACRPADSAYFQMHRPLLTLPAGEQPGEETIRSLLDKTQKLHGMQMDPADLELVCRHALNQAARLAGQMLSGSFPAWPCKWPGQPPACAYCSFQAICGFDDRLSRYRRLPELRSRTRPDGRRLSKKETFIQRLREEADCAAGPPADAGGPATTGGPSEQERS